jgi:hypothetical protein
MGWSAARVGDDGLTAIDEISRRGGVSRSRPARPSAVRLPRRWRRQERISTATVVPGTPPLVCRRSRSVAPREERVTPRPRRNGGCADSHCDRLSHGACRCAPLDLEPCLAVVQRNGQLSPTRVERDDSPTRVTTVPLERLTLRTSTLRSTPVQAGVPLQSPLPVGVAPLSGAPDSVVSSVLQCEP